MSDYVDSLRAAAEALLHKIRDIHENPEYQEVWRTSQLHRGAYTGPSYGYQMAALNDAIAARPVIHDTLCERLQQQCSDWGTYWRAPDAHGVNLTAAQAQELLERALGVEVEIAQTEPVGKLVAWWNGIRPDTRADDSSIRWGAGAEDSRHDIPLYDGPNPIHAATAPALGNLEERARELLAVEFERDVPPFGTPQPDRASQVRRGVWDHAPAHRALVAALSQTRAEDNA